MNVKLEIDQRPSPLLRVRSLLRSFCLFQLLACLTPPALKPPDAGVSAPVAAQAPEKMTELDAWTAVNLMSPGINIGNTLENTTAWETGWGNPRISREFVQGLASLGFKSVRLPVAWDTYAVSGRIQPDKLERVAEVVEWITGAGMFCVLNIHWDGGWIDSGVKEKFPSTHHTFSPDAEQKFPAYWQQIASYFAGKNEKLLFEALNEETNFSNAGSTELAFATVTHVNQLFIDTVRKTGGNNAKRLLIIAGYTTDIEKTCDNQYKLPRDTLPGKLFISVHYYTPWQFCGMTEDADWGKMMPTWGSAEDVKQLNQLFDKLKVFTSKNDIPAYIGELNASPKKESAARIRWMTGVANAARSRGMVPVLWDTGGDVSRQPPYAASAELQQMLKDLAPAPESPASTARN
jgi:endoglucanase